MPWRGLNEAEDYPSIGAMGRVPALVPDHFLVDAGVHILQERPRLPGYGCL